MDASSISKALGDVFKPCFTERKTHYDYNPKGASVFISVGGKFANTGGAYTLISLKCSRFLLPGKVDLMKDSLSILIPHLLIISINLSISSLNVPVSI